MSIFAAHAKEFILLGSSICGLIGGGTIGLTTGLMSGCVIDFGQLLIAISPGGKTKLNYTFTIGLSIIGLGIGSRLGWKLGKRNIFMGYALFVLGGYRFWPEKLFGSTSTPNNLGVPPTELETKNNTSPNIDKWIGVHYHPFYFPDKASEPQNIFMRIKDSVSLTEQMVVELAPPLKRLKSIVEGDEKLPYTKKEIDEILIWIDSHDLKKDLYARDEIDEFLKSQ
ncbi:MAG: hypothetical protein JKX76_02565 [Colwellia sp.]|nr:hypothetical protein [Colwellia sp.]